MLMKRLLLFFIPLLTAGALQSQIINREPLSQRITGYRIDARLDPASKIVYGSMDAFWVNKSSDLVADARLHMYMNAYSSSKTTFFREIRSSAGTKESDYGWIKITSMTNRNGKDLTGYMQFISPDDGNADDKSVLKVNLPAAIKPGDTLFLKIDFETRLPDFAMKYSYGTKRSGFKDNFFFVGQWFPKFGVYETPGMRYATKGGWNCHQFHANSEFYSNHSVYDVKITLPKEYVVGSGGLLLNESEEGESKTLTYRAEDIVDFAWTAWPGYAVFTDQWRHVKIILLLPKERSGQVERQFTAVKHALEYLTENVGPYPWSHLTFIDPPAGTGHAGGMEYTTLFTSWSSYYVPGFLHMPEMVTVHEFGHAYFMGILASNEFEEPWMDEGINSFWEERIMDHYYGKKSGMVDHPLLKIPDVSIARLSYVRSPERQATTNNEYSWNYVRGTYGMMSYQKAAILMHTLMGIVGEETMNEIFREYYRQWSFRHPSGKDFVNVVNDVIAGKQDKKLGPDMNWFFDQTLYGTGICDYKVAEFRNSRVEGTWDKAEKADSLKDDSTTQDSLYKAVVELERIGDIKLPVEVLIHFDNGDEIMENWDGKATYKDFSYTGRHGVDWVKIDPDYKIKMDINYINNSMTSDPDPVPVRRMKNKLVSFMQFLINFISL